MHTPTSFRFYRLLSRLPPRRSYLAKILLVAFIGTHVPLLTLIGCLLARQGGISAHLGILAILLGATVAGTGIAMYGLYCLLAPVRAAADALERYRQLREVPRLPTTHPDEAGRLMANLQVSLEYLTALIDALHQAAHTDHLTGVLNRRAALEQLQLTLQRSLRENTVVHVAIADLDGFKQINDSHGHMVGDAVLRRFTQVLMKHTGAGDWVARWGGDEFLIVLAMERDAAHHVLERVRDALNAEPMADGGAVPIHVNFTHGMAEVRAGEDIEAIIASADDALYQRKRMKGGKPGR